jgi:lysosomal alpha-mannosidase
LYADRPYAEFEWVVGSIPIEDGLVSVFVFVFFTLHGNLLGVQGKEIITRFSTNISSDGYLYTDSNGREMQQRLLNYRPTWKLNITEPVAGKYGQFFSVAGLCRSSIPLTPLFLSPSVTTR